MITARPPDTQTGLYSRIANPYRALSTEKFRQEIQTGINPVIVRNPLAGAGDLGFFARIKAWLRGER